jgi:hypothetical protein
VVVRGPKPATVLHSRKVRIDCAASDPFTTHEVLAAMHETPFRGKRFEGPAVQLIPEMLTTGKREA